MKNNKSESLFHDELYDFIKKETGLEINENTIFFKDLRLNGIDAGAFIYKFSETFHIDMTDFWFDNYFIDEFTFPFQDLFDRWFRKDKIKKKEFDVKHLEKIVREKKWIDV